MFQTGRLSLTLFQTGRLSLTLLKAWRLSLTLFKSWLLSLTYSLARFGSISFCIQNILFRFEAEQAELLYFVRSLSLFRYFASLISASRFVSNWKTRYFPLWAYLLGVHHIPNSPQSPLLNQCESVLGRPHTHWRDKSNDDLWLFLFPFLIFPFIDRRSRWQPEYKSKAARSSTVLTYLTYNYN